MIAKRNEFVKKTAGHRVERRRTGMSGRRGGIRRERRGDMEILILKRVWKNFGTGVKGERRREF
jgi:hypothetical protein